VAFAAFCSANKYSNWYFFMEVGLKKKVTAKEEIKKT
jgi:hypothetical protein